ncbi:hypothetical protein CAOG_00719 [Capsaspora owczarzaki ATCC 30864]|uniref:Amine oxidase domain-containing protein n=1 Tax=Capsaspora owczarzaki (strain ATCC 30864) TaxID=595528 RepID=A0A0D2X0K1_CAPO3|nr:hypothetical protein CAOG_00719 [Capsaspora owczarzaki ATCC 30864]KJE89199.1 hypothetical protein CAOG_000719 [Capsaspora owczarzaki ATCC 30864]|eukprot:XP_004365590.1 hypothetical protein CAOG_00719 [Capsaspora owczarzaki ATCC 30864]
MQCAIVDCAVLSTDAARGLLTRVATELPQLAAFIPHPHDLLRVRSGAAPAPRSATAAAPTERAAATSRATTPPPPSPLVHAFATQTTAFVNRLQEEQSALRSLLLDPLYRCGAAVANHAQTQQQQPATALPTDARRITVQSSYESSSTASGLQVLHGALTATGRFCVPLGSSQEKPAAAPAPILSPLSGCSNGFPCAGLQPNSPQAAALPACSGALPAPDVNFDDVHRLLLRASIVFEYYPICNMAWISFLSVPEHEQDRCIAIQLVAAATKTIRLYAIASGHSRPKAILAAIAADASSRVNESCLAALGFAFVKHPAWGLPASFPRFQSGRAQFLSLSPSGPAMPRAPQGGASLPFPVRSNEGALVETATRLNTSILRQFLAAVCGATHREQVAFDLAASFGLPFEWFQLLQETYQCELTPSLSEATGNASRLASAAPSQLRSKQPQPPHVVILGGGAAGLCAAAALLGRRVGETGTEPVTRVPFVGSTPPRVTILEAGDRLGGRLRSTNTLVDRPVSVGGEFCHGDQSCRFFNLMKAEKWQFDQLWHYEPDQPAFAGIKVALDGELRPFDDESNPHYVAAGRILDHVAALGEKAAILDLPDSLAYKKLSAEERTRWAEEVGEWSKLSLRAIALKFNATVQTAQILDAISTQTAGALWNTHGAVETAREDAHWPHGRANYRLTATNQQLVDSLVGHAQGATVRLNCQAKVVVHEAPDRFRIIDQHGDELVASHVIVTVPLTVLHDEDVEFVPALPPAKQLALQQVSMNSATKVMIRFSRRFWTQDIGVLFAPGMFIQQVWMNVPSAAPAANDEQVVITGFASGSIATRLYLMSPDEIVVEFLRQLDAVLRTPTLPNPATTYATGAEVYHWLDHPFVRGAYSCSTVGGDRSGRQAIARPIGDRVFFAGEGAALDATACIQHAMETGVTAADQALAALAREQATTPASRL